MKSKIVLPQRLVELFSGQAVEEYPHECCGFLIGSVNGETADVLEYLPADNTMQENRERRFIIDPQEYIKIENYADSRNLTLVGIVHSHPNAPDIPSEFDREHAFSGFSYVIISVSETKVNGYRSWRLAEDRGSFNEETIKIIA